MNRVTHPRPWQRRARSERRILSAWEARQMLVYDERSRDAHRLTCVASDLTRSERLGELDRILREVASTGVGTLIVDLRRVRAADSRLIGTLVTVARRARAARVRLVLHPSETVEQWIDVCRVRCVFEGGLRSCLPSNAAAPAVA